MEEENEKLVSDWLRYHEAHEQAGDLKGETSVGDEYFWAIAELDRLIQADPELAWRLIIEIFVRSNTDYQKACLSAGALEDILVQHGPIFIDRIAQIAGKDEGFCKLLSGVWQNDIDQNVWERLQQIVNAA